MEKNVNELLAHIELLEETLELIKTNDIVMIKGFLDPNHRSMYKEYITNQLNTKYKELKDNYGRVITRSD
jgi:hypothetical protein